MTTAELRARFPHTMPVWPVDEDGHCKCYLGATCRRPGKHADPKAPADSPAYAVLCGPGGVLVVDVDTKGGVDGFEQLKGWDLPPTLEVHTPSGGRHLYYRHPGGELTNKKLDTAIDVRANARSEGGHAYVIGPGSPGYLKTSDPCTVTPGDPYELADDEPIADAPELLVAWLKVDTEKESTSPVEPINETHPAWDVVCRLFAEDCRTYEPSKEDGQGSAAMMAIVRRGARRYQLPDDKALELLGEWNSRCTKSDGVTPYPWDDDDLLRALERSRAAGPGEGMANELLAREEGRDLAWKMRLHTQPRGLRELLPVPTSRKQRSESHTYKYKIGELAPNDAADKVSLNQVIAHYAKHPDWSGCWQFNTFAEQILCVDPPIELDAETKGLSSTDITKLRSCLEFDSMLATDKDIQSAVHAAASANQFHPVREYLDGLPLGDPSLFQGLAKRLYGDEGKHADAFLEKTLVAAVRRILEPGCQVDTVLILHGPEQGEGKTQSVEALFTKEWTRRGLPSDLGNRDASHALLGFWGIELGEMTVLLRNESTTTKDFITRQVETYRQYGNGERVRHLRQCVFIGTTNDDDFLRDATGNRRYWVISIPRGHDVPLSWIRENRDALWSAALALALDPEYRHWFTRDEERELASTREPFLETDGWQEKIESYCAGKTYVRAPDVFQTAVGGELKDFDRRKLLRVTDTLKRLGCRSSVRNKTKVWTVPEELASQKPVKVASITDKLPKKTA